MVSSLHFHLGVSEIWSGNLSYGFSVPPLVFTMTILSSFVSCQPHCPYHPLSRPRVDLWVTVLRFCADGFWRRAFPWPGYFQIDQVALSLSSRDLPCLSLLGLGLQMHDPCASVLSGDWIQVMWLASILLTAPSPMLFPFLSFQSITSCWCTALERTILHVKLED